MTRQPIKDVPLERAVSAGRNLVSYVPHLLLAVILGVVLSDQVLRPSHAPWPARGTVVSLTIVVVTVAAAWRRHPTPFLPLNAKARAAMEVHLVEWFLWMRSLACATATVLILLTIDVAGLLPRETFLPLMLCVGSLASANILFEALLRRLPARVNGQIWIQVTCDLAILSLMLHYSGGIENPLSLLFLFHVIISGILFSKLRCYLVGLLAFGFFASLVIAELQEWVPHYTLQIFPHDHQENTDHAAHYSMYVYSRILLQALLLLTTAYFITTIMERLRGRERELLELAEREIESRERLERVVDAAGVGLRLLDDQFSPVWTNSRFLAWFTDEEAVLQNARKTLDDGFSRLAEHDVVGEDGRKNFYRTTTAAMLRADGSAHQTVLLIQDISAQKTAESELLFAEKLAAVGELAGNISHEINNPLGVLSSRLHLLAIRHSGELSEKVQGEIKRMTEMTDRITTITRALLDYCHTGNSERRSAEIASIVERAMSVMRARTAASSVRIVAEVEPGLPLVEVNAGEVEQVIVNLLMNAADVTPPGDCVFVEVTATSDFSGRPAVRIVVRDSGPGVPEALRGRIFEPFFTTKKSGKGTGLGLSICHRIITSHGGNIQLHETPEPGACFQIDLPAHTN